MSILSNLDGYEKVDNFASAYTGPGVYVLFDGRFADGNITYIGKSTVNVMMRVSAHRQTKDFDGVGLILPQHRDERFIHDLEALVVMAFVEKYGELPPDNAVQPRVLPGRRWFDWTAIARRLDDVLFD